MVFLTLVDTVKFAEFLWRNVLNHTLEYTGKGHIVALLDFYKGTVGCFWGTCDGTPTRRFTRASAHL